MAVNEQQTSFQAPAWSLRSLNPSAITSPHTAALRPPSAMQLPVNSDPNSETVPLVGPNTAVSLPMPTPSLQPEPRDDGDDGRNRAGLGSMALAQKSDC